MREIKFRGIAVSDDKFCYGFLTKNQEGGCYIGFHGFYSDAYKFQLVRVNSVGQFTGLRDKNSVDIYEDDLVQINDNVIGVITYQDVGFVIKTTQGEILDIMQYLDIIVVIGNIHQNPELLK
jgi:uncharacterized phage protein (TIGR01671 family)